MVLLCPGLHQLDPVQAQSNNPIEYQVSFKGVENDGLKKLLQEISGTVALRDDPPLSEGLLKRRVRDDIHLFRKALRSKGYFGSRVDARIHVRTLPARVEFQIETGPVYRLKKVRVEMTGQAAGKTPPLPRLKKLGLKSGGESEAGPILSARSAIVSDLRNQGFPLARVKPPEVLVDHEDRTLSVTYFVDSGPFAFFGVTEIKGVTSVEHPFIRRQLPWKPGDTFQADLLDRARTDLLKTGLFNGVMFSMGDRLDSQNRLPVNLQLSERKHRTIKLGLGYTTDEDVIGKVNWEHRNLFHQGESLGFLGQASGIALSLEGKFEKPTFFHPDRALILNLRLADEFPDAYTSKNLTGLVQVRRNLGSGLELALGVGFTFSDIEQFDESENYQLVSLPITFKWDRRDDILDPVRGGDLGIRAAPTHDFFGGETSFVKSSARYSHYYKVLSRPRVILALRGSVGLMAGAERDDIPADLRFYAGGGGSVRGYAYQSVGPQLGGQPLGGRSLLTFSSEIRIKITDTVGLVPFLDGGNIFESEIPDFDRSLRWGAGLGLRYFTPVGPLRLDAACPLDRRDMDDAFQIYISLGHTF